jgi:hypothetical protein
VNDVADKKARLEADVKTPVKRKKKKAEGPR